MGAPCRLGPVCRTAGARIWHWLSARPAVPSTAGPTSPANPRPPSASVNSASSTCTPPCSPATPDTPSHPAHRLPARAQHLHVRHRVPSLPPVTLHLRRLRGPRRRDCGRRVGTVGILLTRRSVLPRPAGQCLGVDHTPTPGPHQQCSADCFFPSEEAVLPDCYPCTAGCATPPARPASTPQPTPPAHGWGHKRAPGGTYMPRFPWLLDTPAPTASPSTVKPQDGRTVGSSTSTPAASSATTPPSRRQRPPRPRHCHQRPTRPQTARLGNVLLHATATATSSPPVPPTTPARAAGVPAATAASRHRKPRTTASENPGPPTRSTPTCGSAPP